MFASPDVQSENSDIQSSSAVPIPCGTEKMFDRMIRYSSCGKSQGMYKIDRSIYASFAITSYLLMADSLRLLMTQPCSLLLTLS